MWNVQWERSGWFCSILVVFVAIIVAIRENQRPGRFVGFAVGSAFGWIAQILK